MRHKRTVNRQTKMIRSVWFITLSLGVMAPCSAQTEMRSAAFRDALVASVCAEIHRVRQIGLRQDRSAVPALLDILQKAVRDGVDEELLLVRPQRGMPWSASYPAHLHTATIVALGRLGDLRAIPVLEAFRNHHEYRRFAPLVSVAVARIKAEQAVPQADTLAKWQAKVERFAEALGLSLSDLISTVRQTRGVHSGRSAPAQPQLALRALAEMAAEAYRQGCQESFDWLQRAGVEWDADRAAWLTAELAVRSPEQRIAWLMEQIRTKSALTVVDEYLFQALADQGERAVPALEKWLNALWDERTSEKPAPYTRTDRMLRLCFALLSGTGSSRANSLLQQQRELCQGNEYLRSNLALILKQSPWTFVSDW
ncbi:MAG: hypothetical protein WHT28_00165 [Fimbriimonadales bacterium]|jgi:hypothetical protein